MPPACCTDTAAPGLVHDPVPVVTQYATADLIGPVAYGGHDPGDDPAWETSGAPTQAIYRRWCRHLCGIACLRMALLHRDGHAPNLFTLLNGARHQGAYIRQTDGNIQGLIYRPFVEYIRSTHQLAGEVHPQLDTKGLTDLLDQGRMVMASVSKEIRRPENAPERRGGHLVLAIGHQDGQILFRNPSGHTPQARTAALPSDRFEVFFGGRGLSLDPRRTVRHTYAVPVMSRPVASHPTT
jgi:hypothetical protein